MTVTLDWDQIGSDGSQTLQENGQSVTVSVSTPHNAQGKEWFVENGMLKAWDVSSDTNADIRFSTEVENVSFTLLDVDRLDEITIMTKDADGNPVEVQFEATGVHEVNGNTVTGTQTNAPGPSPTNDGQDIEIVIPGPVMTFWIVLDDGPERSYSGTVAVSDIKFDIASVADGTVEGTSGGDIIDVAYVGDPDGDRVDNDDAILPGETGDDDLILGFAGDDTILAGEGDDEVYGGAGNDSIAGEAGNDVIYGDDGNGGTGNVSRESFEWDQLTGHQIDSTATQVTGDVSVTYTRIEDTGHHFSRLGDEHLNTTGINSGGETVDSDSSLYSETGGQGNTGAFQWDFSEPVGNVSFNVNDIDGDGLVKITAYDANGNAIPVTLAGGAGLTLRDTDSVAGADTADSNGGYQANNSATYTLQVNIAGPVSRIVLEHDQDGHNNSGINVTDIYFDTGAGVFDSGPDGDDVIDGGAGDDLLVGEGGDDVIDGGTGNDVIFGDNAGNGGTGPEFTGPRESFNWQPVSGSQSDTTVTQDTGVADVVYTRIVDTGHHFTESDNHTHLNVAGIDTGGETIDTDSSLYSETNGQGNTGAFQWEFSEPVGNVEFNINDLDGDGLVTVTAYDADGNEIPVTLVGGSDIQINGNVADAVGPYQNPNDPDTTVQVTVAGPVSRLVVEHTQDGGNNSGINITDIYFDTGYVAPTSGDGAGGDDIITGGEGADMMFGEGGNDTFVVSSADEGAGDVIVGGNGPDQNTDLDVLDLRGAGRVTIDQQADANDAGATEGTVTFADGSTLEFENIEQILTDPQNTGPVAGADDLDAGEDDPAGVIGNVLDNDSDPDGDPLTVGEVNGDPAGVGTPVAGDNGGLITINPDGTVIFDPNGEFESLGEGEEATTTVTYTVDDGNGGTETATVTITVTGTNDAPTAVADTGSTDQETVIALDNVLGNDTDPEGDSLTVSEVNSEPSSVGLAVTASNGGLVTINPDGTASFDPNGDFDDLAEGETAQTSVTYGIVDGNGGFDTTTLTITVTGTNDGPVAVADDLGAGEDDPAGVIGNVLDNDSDPDGDPLTVSEVNGDPAGVGTPVPADGGGLVTIAPDGTVTFDPNGEFEDLGEGETEEVTVTYTVTDPSGAEVTETVTITVTGSNDAPTAVMDDYTTGEDAPSDLGNVLGNDTDPENDPLTVTEVNGDPAGVGTPVPAVGGGLVTINPDGSISFDPNGEFDDLAEGETEDVTVTYTVTDPDGAEDTTTVTITVTGGNDGPVAVADDLDAGEDDPAGVIGNVLDNDSDPDGDPLTVSEVNGDPAGVGTPVPADGGGLVTIAPDGTVTFDPNGEFEDLGEGETEEVTVTYTVTDPSGAEVTETVTITVTGSNDAPTAVMDDYTTGEDAPSDLGNVLGNDTDPENDPLTVTEVNGDPAGVGTPVPAVGGGLVTINPDGSISFDPNGEFDDLAEGETEDVTVTYTVTDPDGAEDTTTVTITVTGGNDGPVAVADTFSTDEDTTSVVGNVLDNDSDPDGDPLTVGAVNGDPASVGTPVPAVGGGLVTIAPDGTVTFDPNGEFDDLAPGETAEVTIEYTVTDPSGAEATETVTITVDGVNDGPDATDNAYSAAPTEAAGDVDGNVITDDSGNGTDSDPEGDNLTVSAVGGAAAGVGAAIAGDNGGLFTIAADGTVDFDANGEFDDLGLGDTAETSVTYTIVDENGAEDTATVTFTVSGANDGTVQGTNGDDVIAPGYVDDDGDIVDAGDNILPGKGPDDDVIQANGGDDSVLAGVGDDTVFGGTGNDTIDGEEGDDLLLGGEGDDTVSGGIGDDRIFGADGDDVLEGGDGNDTIEGSEGEDSIQGGDGDDDIWGGLDDDIVRGGDGNDTVGGGDGDDDVRGGDGDDELFGGTGNDDITGGEGSDLVEGGDGDDVIDAGNHADPLPDVGYPQQGLFPGYDADTDPTNDLDTVFGGAGNDVISTGDDDDSIFGGTGDDTIDAGLDDDYVVAGTGNDTIIGGEGNDEIEGGDGDDLIFGGLDDSAPDFVNIPDDGSGPFGFPDLVTDNNIDTVFGGAGNDTIFGRDDADVLFGGEDDDLVDGGIDDDQLFGDEGDDTVLGGQGNDLVVGGQGDDIVDGGIGDDQLFGEEGDDTIIGGEGIDEAFGGLGSDTFLGGNAGDNVVGGEDPDDSDIDVLDLTGSNVDFITYDPNDPEAGVVTFLDGSTMTFSEIENVIPCFTPGTTIATPKGERLVEELTVGDRIITRDNGIQEIAWVGHKSMDGKQLAANPHLKPILIKAGSLGDGLPERDMLVSPNHRVLVASEMTQLYFEEREVLAAAKHMTGAQGIHAVDVMATTYIHFMFERHEVVLSNGAWTESFQPGDYSLKGIGNSQRNEIMELFPELATKSGLEDYQSARRALKKHEAKLLMK